MQIQTPDIGVDKATVADILVKVGDTIAVDDSIVLLESDKASVEVPSTAAGVVKSILVQQGDEVTEGAVLIELETDAQTAAATEVAVPQAEVDAAPKQDVEPVVAAAPSSAVSTTAQEVDVQVPDIGVEKAVVGEILVQVGDAIDVDQSIIVVESDKATVEVPSTVSGTVTAIQINTGDTVKESVVILKVKTAAVTQMETPQAAPVEAAAATASAATASTPQTAASAQVEVAVPDLGVDKATVAEILVQVGDTVAADQGLIVVESDKATVEVPEYYCRRDSSDSCGIRTKCYAGQCLSDDSNCRRSCTSCSCSSSSCPYTKRIASS